MHDPGEKLRRIARLPLTRNAVGPAAKATGLDGFPESCPWTYEQVSRECGMLALGLRHGLAFGAQAVKGFSGRPRGDCRC